MSVSSCRCAHARRAAPRTPPVIALLFHVEHLNRIRHVQTRLNKPVSITDFHAFVLLVLQFFADRQVFKLLLIAARTLRQLARDFGQEGVFSV